jgi:hypothetical protein
MMDVCPATTYEPVTDLQLITAYFNPLGYRSKRRNYEIFKEALVRSGLPLLTIECAIGNAPLTLPRSADVVHVHARDFMWQKERLLNLVIAQLPRQCTKVAWLDSDVLFENPRWAVEASKALDHCVLVQPFATAIRLPQGSDRYSGVGRVRGSFAAVFTESPQHARRGDRRRHGETGMAWAARRELLDRCQLYDTCIIGGGDHVMAHAMSGTCESPCIDRLVGTDTAHRAHFARWAETYWGTVQGSIGWVPGAALHLWHGERSNRRYSLRHRELERFAFDPHTDLRIGNTGCWEWASDKTAMQRRVIDYFVNRQEDGIDGTAAASTYPACEPGSGR